MISRGCVSLAMVWLIDSTPVLAWQLLASQVRSMQGRDFSRPMARIGLLKNAGPDCHRHHGSKRRCVLRWVVASFGGAGLLRSRQGSTGCFYPTRLVKKAT